MSYGYQKSIRNTTKDGKPLPGGVWKWVAHYGKRVVASGESDSYSGCNECIWDAIDKDKDEVWANKDREFPQDTPVIVGDRKGVVEMDGPDCVDQRMVRFYDSGKGPCEVVSVGDLTIRTEEEDRRDLQELLRSYQE